MDIITATQVKYFLGKNNISIIAIILLLIMAGCNRNEHEIPSDFVSAYYLSPREIEILNKKVNHGDIEAAERLANYYSNVEDDFIKSAEYLRIAAKYGNPRAQHHLANYLVRLSSLEEQQEGIFWYEMAAKQEYERSQMKLSWIYEKGEIVKQDFCRAKYWREKSAQSGSTLSMIKISNYLEEGICCNPDNIKAYAWLLVAEKHINPKELHPDTSFGKEALQKIAFFEKHLSESEKKQAQNEYDKLMKEIEPPENSGGK